jgi:hypothetical protein
MRNFLLLLLCLYTSPLFAEEWINYTSNPLIVDGTYHRRDPSEVLYINGTYYLYYNRLDAAATDSFDTLSGDIACSFAPHPAGPWTEQSVVLVGGDGTGGNYGYVAPSATVDGANIYLFYNQLIDFDPNPRDKVINVATGSTSDPCGTFTPSTNNPVFAPTNSEGDWDEDLAASQYVMKYDQTTWRMYYKGRDNTTGLRYVGLATTPHSSFPEGWSRYVSNPIFGNSVNGSPALQVDDMAVLSIGGQYYMMFQEPTTTTDAQWYKSANGINGWTDAQTTFSDILNSSLTGSWAETENMGYATGTLHGKAFYMNSGGYTGSVKDAIGFFFLKYGLIDIGGSGTMTLGGSGSLNK